jgi:hypothetical protein
VYREHLAAMIRAARESGVRVLLVSPTVVYEDLAGPENDRLAAYVEAECRRARETGVLFADAHEAFRRERSQLARLGLPRARTA